MIVINITISSNNPQQSFEMGQLISEAVSLNREHLRFPRSLWHRLLDAIRPDKPYPNIGTEYCSVSFKCEDIL